MQGLTDNITNIRGQGQGQGLDLQGLIPEANVGYHKNYKSEKLELA